MTITLNLRTVNVVLQLLLVLITVVRVFLTKVRMEEMLEKLYKENPVGTEQKLYWRGKGEQQQIING